ncbi:hypothetical protein [Streptomyces syringium]|uniref:Uncharacterized protein n=1 Tax=Streptomyces syringium TaxID=76729 RepID=A0ABS4XW69_9ACTN|nr:hypothetical protein [Streptomyces syringium]MBP2400763.1 hypothetical protein [Streptomyces syringium]
MSKYILCASSPLRIWTIDTSAKTVGGPVTLDWKRWDPNHEFPFTFVADAARSLVYHTSASKSVQEIDVSNPKSPTVKQLQTSKGVNLMCAALAGGFGQPSHVDQRLYAGGSDGFIYTFPLDSSGKTRKATSDPAPYEVLEAHNRPIIDLAITSDGTHAFALIQSNDGKAAAVTKDLKPMPHPPRVHYLADRPQWDTIPNPRHIKLSPDERHLIVTSDGYNCTIIDTTTNESHLRSLASDAWVGPVYVDNTSAYFCNAIRDFHNVELASGGVAKSGTSSGLVGLAGIGDGHVLLTTSENSSGDLTCVLFTYDGKERVDIAKMNFSAGGECLLFGRNLMLEGG